LTARGVRVSEELGRSGVHRNPPRIVPPVSATRVGVFEETRLVCEGSGDPGRGGAGQPSCASIDLRS
jgi:hypothetical protein